MNKPYRPRLPEVIAMLDAMPANVDTLTEVSGRPAVWAQQMLSRMVCDRIIQQRHGVYSRVAEVEPSYMLQIVEALRSGPMTRKAIEAIGVNPNSVSAILTKLERRGLIECDSTSRPFRYRLPGGKYSAGLEALAAYEAAR
jgi:predicted Rossmann fold nucleotide-binding protein DprA/Smf involved in DNA uptake